jgi:hypothetical protein
MAGAPTVNSSGTEALCSACGHSRMRLNGTLDAFFKIAGSEGPASLFRGMLPTLYVLARHNSYCAFLHPTLKKKFQRQPLTFRLPLAAPPPGSAMSVPATVIYFTVYDRLRDHLGGDPHTATSNWAPATAGAIARSTWLRAGRGETPRCSHNSMQINAPPRPMSWQPLPPQSSLLWSSFALKCRRAAPKTTKVGRTHGSKSSARSR